MDEVSASTAEARATAAIHHYRTTAESELLAALAKTEHAQGSTSLKLVPILTQLAEVQGALQRPADGARQVLRALGILTHTHGQVHASVIVLVFVTFSNPYIS